MLSRWLAVALLCLFPSAALAGGIETIFHDQHTVFFIALNVGLTMFFVLWKFDRWAVVHGPEVLTTVGIFGCFFGIALALLNFDARNVTTSVPQLLEGVKTAFWASVSGVLGSLVIRLRHYLQKTPIRQTDGAPKAATLDDVVAATQSLQKSLSGGEEGSLLSQMKLMRQEQTDQLLALRGSFDTFAKKMAEDGSKALIEALREVIADFNAQINEQFGENFKQLNAAVEKLVMWQQQYKEELTALQAVQRAGADDLRGAAESLGAAASHSVAFTESALRLEQILRGLSQQYALIQQSQDALSKVLVEMKDVAPQFAKKLEDLSDSLRQGVAKVQGEVAEVVKNFGAHAQSSSAELKNLLTDTVKRSQNDVNEQLLRSLETIRQAVVVLDQGLQEELTKSLQSLGRQLASLSEKFVSDYSPLTDRLREVVRMAGRGA